MSKGENKSEEDETVGGFDKLDDPASFYSKGDGDRKRGGGKRRGSERIDKFRHRSLRGQYFFFANHK